MSPTVFRYKGFRFFFFSREENRIHIHVHSQDGEAKFWLEPILSLAHTHGLSSKQLNELQEVVNERREDIIQSWKEHFER